MGFWSKLFGGEKNSSKFFSNKELVEVNACPNCWGNQQYDGKFETFYKDQTKSNIAKDKKHQKAFIAQFVETNVSGIKLKREGNKKSCVTCNAKF